MQNQIYVWDYEIATSDRVAPGTVKYAIDLNFKNNSGSIFSEIIPVELVIEVTAVSTMFKLLEIPAFFLIPGVVFITIFGFLIKNKWRQFNELKGDKILLVVANITVSIIIVLMYSFLNNFGRILQGKGGIHLFDLLTQQFLRIYGLSDVVSLWIIAFLMAIVGAAIVFIVIPKQKDEKKV